MMMIDLELAQAVDEVARGLEEVRLDDGMLVRQVLIRPEFDCYHECALGSERCRRDSLYYHGVGARKLHFGVSVAGKGGVSFVLFTHIYPESVVEREGAALSVLGGTVEGTVDVHRPEPYDEWSRGEPPIKDCEVTGGDCWMGGGTATVGDVGAKLLVEGGAQAVWSWLAETWLPVVMGGTSS